jgi:hypothetical protein
MRQLIELWTKVLGTPPSDQQFLIWMESHPPDVVRHGLMSIKTAAFNARVKEERRRRREWKLRKGQEVGR